MTNGTFLAPFNHVILTRAEFPARCYYFVLVLSKKTPVDPRLLLSPAVIRCILDARTPGCSRGWIDRYRYRVGIHPVDVLPGPLSNRKRPVRRFARHLFAPHLLRWPSVVLETFLGFLGRFFRMVLRGMW